MVRIVADLFLSAEKTGHKDAQEELYLSIVLLSQDTCIPIRVIDKRIQDEICLLRKKYDTTGYEVSTRH